MIDKLNSLQEVVCEKQLKSIPSQVIFTITFLLSEYKPISHYVLLKLKCSGGFSLYILR